MQNGNIIASPTYAASFSFTSAGDEIITIKPNGEVLINPKYSKDEAAQLFWECVRMAGLDIRKMALNEAINAIKALTNE